MLVNLTGHRINLISSYGSVTVPREDQIARCNNGTKEIATLEYNGVSIPMTEVEHGSVTGLPEPRANTFYIVSSIVVESCPERGDLLSPKGHIHDHNGKTIGCRSLGR